MLKFRFSFCGSEVGPISGKHPVAAGPVGALRTLAFTLSEMRSLWRVLGSGMTWSDFHFDTVTILAAVWVID